MTYECVWDIETAHNISGNRDWENNKVTSVFLTQIYSNGEMKDTFYTEKSDVGFFKAKGILLHKDCVRWIGHNILFDILYLDVIDEYYKGSYEIWDTMLCERYITGHTYGLSLKKDLCPRYGIERKDDTLQKSIKEGGASLLSEKELYEYNRQDVIDTATIYIRQQSKANTKHILDIGKDAVTIAHLQRNGITVDGSILNKVYAAEVALGDKYETLFWDTVKSMTGLPVKILRGYYTSGSPKLLTFLLYGGSLDMKILITELPLLEDYICDTLVEKRTRAYTVISFNGILPANNINYRWKRTSQKLLSGGALCSFGADTLYDAIHDLVELIPNMEDFFKALKHTRIVSKCREIKETTNGLSEKTVISSNYSLTNVATGRLSSSKPNLQNVPSVGKSALKKCFVATKDNQVCVVVDYSQVEMVCLGLFFKDIQLIKDIREGMDFHCFFLAAMKNEDYDSVVNKIYVEKDEEYIEARKDTKSSFTFPFIYGSGNKALVKSTGLPEATITTMVKTFYNRYPQIRAGYSQLDEQYGRFASKTSGVYGLLFKWWFGYTSFLLEKHKLKNYPIQGMAGVLIKVLCRLLLEYTNAHKECILTNTVHDSVYISCDKEYLPTLKKDLKRLCINDTVVAFNKRTGNNIDFSDILKIDVSVGNYYK